MLVAHPLLSGTPAAGAGWIWLIIGAIFAARMFPGEIGRFRSPAGLAAGCCAVVFLLFPVPFPGGIAFPISLVPAVTLLCGPGTATLWGLAFAAISTLLGASPSAAGWNLLFAVQIPIWATLLGFRTACRWLRPGPEIRNRMIPAGFSAWFACLTTATIAGLLVPWLGRALWGVIAPAAGVVAPWFGIAQALLTMLICVLPTAFLPGSNTPPPTKTPADIPVSG